MVKIKIRTKGMHCKSCEMLIKGSLEELDGVSKAEASFKTGMVSVDFDNSKVSIDKIKDTIRKEGHEVIG